MAWARSLASMSERAIVRIPAGDSPRLLSVVLRSVKP